MRTFTRSLGLFLLCPLLFTACKKDSVAANTEQPAALTQGQWKVEAVHGTNATSSNSYAAYRLQFATDGTLTCLSDASSAHGTWKWQRKVETGALRLQVIDGRAEIALLHNEWNVTSCTSSRLTLAHDGLELRFVRP